MNTHSFSLDIKQETPRRIKLVNGDDLNELEIVLKNNGEIINHCASVTGPRSIPTGFIVLPEETGHGE